MNKNSELLHQDPDKIGLQTTESSLIHVVFY